ncbi:MAG TPA: cupin domain-containing protein [Longimicrobium sp.]
MNEPSNPRARELVKLLGLQPHPEGGAFREVFRSPLTVQPADSRSERSALTAIYFLLADGGASRWHRVASDESWCWLEGDLLELWRMPEAAGPAEREVLGPVSDGVHALGVVPAGEWQAARTLGAYTLVACMVGPGFDFADFQMLSDLPADAERTRQNAGPRAAELI